jgi:hypothetical protein
MMSEKEIKKTRKRRGEKNIMLLNQQQMEVPKWNTVISCAAQVQEPQQKNTCKSLGPYRYCLTIQNI